MKSFEDEVIERNRRVMGLTEAMTRQIYLEQHRGEYTKQSTREWFEFYSAGVEHGRHDEPAKARQ